MRRRGRPPKFVPDPNGRPIVGLSYNKKNKSFYATYSEPRALIRYASFFFGSPAVVMCLFTKELRSNPRNTLGIVVKYFKKLA